MQSVRHRLKYIECERSGGASPARHGAVATCIVMNQRSHATLSRASRGSFCRAMRCISAAYVVMRCLSVCPSVRVSVTFVSCVKTNKDIFEIFSPSGSKAILVFPYQTGWRYSDGNSANGGVVCRCGRQKRNSGRISGFAAYTGLQCCQPYESRSVKNKAVTVGGERRAHRGVRHQSNINLLTSVDTGQILSISTFKSPPRISM